MDMRQAHEYNIISEMVAKLIAPTITEPTLRIAVESQVVDNTNKAYPALPTTEDALDSPVQRFVDGLLQSVQKQGEQDDFLGFLGGIFNTAAKVDSTAISCVLC
ncbi:hypothetical protein IL306_000814 [Fusarium sp. DS 682]|nr:hypothetical protein IL306_000814 [Fusarium sp. DS 682]